MWTEKSAISTIDIAHTHIIMHYGLWHFEQWRIEIQLESPIWRRNGKTKWQKMWCDENREELCHFANEHNSTPFLIAPGWFLLLIFGWHLEYPGFKFKNTHKYTVINSGRVSLNLFVIIFHFIYFACENSKWHDFMLLYMWKFNSKAHKWHTVNHQPFCRIALEGDWFNFPVENCSRHQFKRIKCREKMLFHFRLVGWVELANGHATL